MALTDITTTASIRSVLGVSEREIRDEVLLDPIYTTLLTEKLYSLSATLFDDFVTTKAIVTPTAVQLRFLNLVQTYSAYYIASRAVDSAPMFAPRVIKDAQTQVERVDDPFKTLKQDIKETLGVLRVSLMTIYNQINATSPLPTAVERLRVVIAPLGVNPVTG